MSEEKYQGWTNRETWAVNLWLANEELIREIVEEEAGGIKGDLLGCALGRVNRQEVAEDFAEGAE